MHSKLVATFWLLRIFTSQTAASSLETTPSPTQQLECYGCNSACNSDCNSGSICCSICGDTLVAASKQRPATPPFKAQQTSTPSASTAITCTRSHTQKHAYSSYTFTHAYLHTPTHKFRGKRVFVLPESCQFSRALVDSKKRKIQSHFRHSVRTQTPNSGVERFSPSPPKSTESKNWVPLVQVQIGPNFQFEFVSEIPWNLSSSIRWISGCSPFPLLQKKHADGFEFRGHTRRLLGDRLPEDSLEGDRLSWSLIQAVRRLHRGLGAIVMRGREQGQVIVNRRWQAHVTTCCQSVQSI